MSSVFDNFESILFYFLFVRISLGRILLGLSYLFNFFNLNLFLVYFLKPGDVIENDKPGLQTFCHSANTKYLIHMWRSLTVRNNT